MRYQRIIAILICIALAIAFAGCVNQDGDIVGEDIENSGDETGFLEETVDYGAVLRNDSSISGKLFYVGAEKEFNIDMQSNGILELRVTEKSVLKEDEIIHRDDIATINENRITILKSGYYKLWVITEKARYIFYYDLCAVDISEMKTEKCTGIEFETTVYFQESVNQGEVLPFVVINKNITGKTLVKTTPHLDPYMGAPVIAVFTLIDGYKLYVGEAEAYATMIGKYMHAPGQESRLLKSYAPIIERYSIIHLEDGKYLSEDDPFLTTLGFESNLYVNDYEENKRIRDELWAELKTRYDLGDPEYNWEWNKIYSAYPIFNPAYCSIVAPKGYYNIELSNGQIIENAFEII